MNLYAELNAVMAWLFKEMAADDVTAAFGAAEAVLASDLTLLECDRALNRALATGALSDLEVARRRFLLEAASSRWMLLRIDGEVLERARRRFPQEPVRALASLAGRFAVPEIVLLSLDQRVRDNGAALGFDVLLG